jgi:NAD-dependent SIR2 family protein deacetylase
MKTGLLLGAGFSCDFGMPISRELTEIFLNLFSRSNSRSLIAGMANHQPFSVDRPINKAAIAEVFDLLLAYKEKKGENYEELLSHIQALSEDYGKSQSDRDSYHYTFCLFYEIIHNLLAIYQSESYKALYHKNLKWFSKLEDILSAEETWVFTLNHDIFLECLAIDLGIPITYGATGTIEFPVSNIEMDERIYFSTIDRSLYRADNPSFLSGQKGINLVKLHGGLTEHSYKDECIICNQSLNKATSKELVSDFYKIQRMAYYHQSQKVPDSKDRVITNANGELDLISKAMLTGGKKYSKTAKPKKGEEKLIVFDDILGQLDELTIMGYGFGDKHVNFRIANAMARRENLSIRIIDPNLRKVPEFLEPFDYDSRIHRAICGAANWIDYSKSQKWNIEQIESLKNNSKIRNEIKSRVESLVQTGKFNKREPA